VGKGLTFHLLPTVNWESSLPSMAGDMEMHNRSKDSATSEAQDVNFNGEKCEDGNAMNMNTYGKQRLDVGPLKQISSGTVGLG